MVWNPPPTCDNGHLLQPPNVKRGWVQCGCPRAVGRPKGHDYVLCLTCQQEIREGDCDEQET